MHANLMTVIRASAGHLDLDAAVLPIQVALGVTSGDYAGIYFSGEAGEGWADRPPEERLKLLRDYAAEELRTALCFDPIEPVEPGGAPGTGCCVLALSAAGAEALAECADIGEEGLEAPAEILAEVNDAIQTLHTFAGDGVVRVTFSLSDGED